LRTATGSFKNDNESKPIKFVIKLKNDNELKPIKFVIKSKNGQEDKKLGSQK